MYVDVEAPSAAAGEAAGEAADESISTWGQGLAKEPADRRWNCEACTFCNTMRGSSYAWLRAHRATHCLTLPYVPGCEPMSQCMACKCWQSFPRMLEVSFDNAGHLATLTPVHEAQDFGPVLCPTCKAMGPKARPTNYFEAHSHGFRMSDLGSNDSEEARKCNIALGHYVRLGGDGRRVHQVDIYHNPVVQAKFSAKEAEFKGAGKDTQQIWIFHETPQKENVAKICTNGFLVGGQDGHPIANADVYGKVRLP